MLDAAFWSEFWGNVIVWGTIVALMGVSAAIEERKAIHDAWLDLVHALSSTIRKTNQSPRR